MQFNNRFVLGAALFLIVIIAFATKSGAFNTFKSSEDETRVNSEYINTLREIRDSNAQILEQLKIANQLLQNGQGTHGQGGAAAGNGPVAIQPPLIRANP